MKPESVIKMREKMGSSSLETRAAAISLFQDVHSCFNRSQSVIFDFDGIHFISRSFADQFHKEKIRINSCCDVVTDIENADYNIIDMLKAVSNTQNASNRIFISHNKTHFDSEDMLFKFLHTI